MHKRFWNVLWVVLQVMLLVGVMLSVWMIVTDCTVFQLEDEKVQDLEYIIVNEANQPQEVQLLVEANQEDAMKMCYTDQGWAYIIIGYGAQDTSGYSIEVVEVYETENTVCVNTNLIGPASGEAIVELTTYPYIVIRIEENDKVIIYE